MTFAQKYLFIDWLQLIFLGRIYHKQWKYGEKSRLDFIYVKWGNFEIRPSSLLFINRIELIYLKTRFSGSRGDGTLYTVLHYFHYYSYDKVTFLSYDK